VVCEDFAVICGVSVVCYGGVRVVTGSVTVELVEVLDELQASSSGFWRLIRFGGERESEKCF
jgi:hypothetical protein